MTADTKGLRISEFGSARFVNNTPETWTMYVMRLSPQVLCPGDTWTTPQLVRPGMIAHVFCRCQCTTGPSSNFNGRWMYHPLVSVGWEHEIKYWAWRHGMWFESGEQRPKYYYTGYLSLMEGLILLEHMFKVGMKDLIVDKFIEGLRFFMGGDSEGHIRDTLDNRSWLLACLDDVDIAKQVPNLKMMLRCTPAVAPKVQTLMETVFTDEQVLEYLVPMFVSSLESADANESSTSSTRTPTEKMPMSMLTNINNLIMADPELRLLQMPLMLAMGDLMQVKQVNANNQMFSMLGKILLQLPPHVITPVMKYMVRVIEPTSARDESIPLDISRLRIVATDLTTIIIRDLEKEDANSVIARHREWLIKLAKNYPVLVLYMCISSLSSHGLVYDEFMELATAMNIEKRASNLRRARATSEASEDLAGCIPPEVCAQFKSILEVGEVGDATTRATNVKQMDVPPLKWALTVRQFVEFFDLCKATPKWKELENSRKIITMYDMDHTFVRSVSRKTGCSVALLMNQEPPLTSSIMLSHCWGEDVAECSEALEGFCYDRGVPITTPVWFCLLSIYQPGSESGDPGPTINDQVILKPSPFQQVIRASSVKNGGGMVVLQTTTGEVYDRLWCVHEIDEALDQNVMVRPACSARFALVQSVARAVAEADGYMPGIADFTVTTISAECGSPEDTERIRRAVEAKDGGYERLDRVINEFRSKMLETDLAVWLKPDASRLLETFHNHGVTILEKNTLVKILTQVFEYEGNPKEPAAVIEMIESMFPGKLLQVPIDDFLNMLCAD